jgi:4-amino-4-deoxy-L-arabinose transferase-like glycosyltransferase
MNFKHLLRANLPLLCILAGAALFTYTSGPFQNWDTNIEFQAVQGVLQWGIPYTEPGAMINQPPIAFYLYAAPLTVLGATEAAGALVNSAFGLACAFLVYLLGKVWFN